jgi:putative hydrolase of HD superfamily
MIFNKNLANELFRAFYIDRWNERVRPMSFTEMDKHSHKLILCYCIGKYEENNNSINSGLQSAVNWNYIFKDAVFELLRRIATSDIKSPIFQKIKSNKEVFVKLNEYVFRKYENIIEDTKLKNDFYNFLFDENDRVSLECRIIDAAHIYASFWEFNIVKQFNPFQHQNEKIEHEIRNKLDTYSDLKGIDYLLKNHSISNFIDLCGQLRFQIRWAQTPRLPKTSVLGHTLLVATIVYFIMLDLDVCKKRLFNNFFGGLFHDLPEVVTRDIISPVKRSSDKLDNLISELEKQLAESEIYPHIEKEWVDEIKYFTQNEFLNKVIIGNKIEFVDSTEEMNSKYNEDKFCPFDGEIIKFADQYAAYMEAKKSIEVGITSPDLEKAIEYIIEKHSNIVFAHLDMSTLFGN